MEKHVINHVLLGKGRMNRAQFSLIFILILGFCIFLDVVVSSMYIFLILLSGYDFLMQIVDFLITFGPILVFLTLITSIEIRRGHDIGLRTFVMIIAMIFQILLIVALIYLGLGVILSAGYYTKDFIISGVGLFTLLIAIPVILMVYPGSKNINKYGDVSNGLTFTKTIRLWLTGGYRDQAVPPVQINN